MKLSVIVQTLLGIGAAFFLAGALWWYQSTEPQRLEAAQQAVLARQLDDAMTIYAENCVVCHGIRGEGIGATPALDRPDLREADPDSLHKIISRGLYNTAMPAWNMEDGGPLSDYQITELVQLIRYGDWQAVQDRVVNLGLAPTVPFTSEPDAKILTAVEALPDGDLLAQGIQVYARECVACHGPDGQGTNLAPALNTPQVRATAPETLERTIRYGVRGTLMAGWDNVLADQEIQALLALLTRWDEVPSGAIPEPDKPIPVTEESLALGEQLFAQNCSFCHGPNGQGTRRAPALNVKGYLESTSDLALQQIITNGVPGTAMPAWGTRLTEAEIQAIVGYIRSWEPTAPEVAEPAAQGGGPWWALSGNEPMGTTAVGGGGGPPWMREDQGQGGRGPRWRRQTPTAVAPQPMPTSLATNTPGTPTTPAAQPTTEAAVPPAGPAESQSGPPGFAAGHTPQWMQPPPPPPWWEDTYALLLIGSVVFAGVFLTGVGFVGARWRA
ncbi:MAG TPA: c-type cytochrome [Chloroflexi bacterium]|nr:c-type cytochrome [Chloroflexota bacterium]